MRNWSTLKKLVWLRGAVISAASYIWTIVTGAAPLVLPGAVAKPLKSLIQYGVCEENDGDVYCNNGKLVAVDDELPSGYKRIESIAFYGHTYYNTKEKLYGTDIVTMTISDFSSSTQGIFGAYDGAKAYNFSMRLQTRASVLRAFWNYGQKSYSLAVDSPTTRTITFGAGGTTGFETNVSHPTEEFVSDSFAVIGALPNFAPANFSGIITGSITVSSRLKYIPCERTSDGAIGYYEAINGVFLEPLGSMPPIAGGYDYTHSHVVVVGTPEVLTVSGTDHTQTASVSNLFSSGDAADTQDIITGTVTRKVEVTASNGTITISPLATPTTETVEAQMLRTEAGDNTISATAEVTGISLKAEYAKGV